ncbi:MAG: peptidoglycan-binding protein [Chitinophagaceae bacterium]|nr:MAG: peptidoglycan-binding protein [Chitinophagaceae bacterium]
MLGHRRTDSDLLANQQSILKIAKSQIGIREATGNNDGKQVEKYLNYTGNKKGEPWCASFVSWVFGQAGFKHPRTAWSPALLPNHRLISTAVPAAVFGIYFSNKNRIAHVGLVEMQKGDWLYTVEGNTNLEGSREGDGVYRKLRHVKTIKRYANWLANNEKGVWK